MKRGVARAGESAELIRDRWKGPKFIQGKAENRSGRPRVREQRQKVPRRLTREMRDKSEVIAGKVIANRREVRQNRGQTHYHLGGSPAIHHSGMVLLRIMRTFPRPVAIGRKFSRINLMTGRRLTSASCVHIAICSALYKMHSRSCPAIP